MLFNGNDDSFQWNHQKGNTSKLKLLVIARGKLRCHWSWESNETAARSLAAIITVSKSISNAWMLKTRVEAGAEASWRGRGWSAGSGRPGTRTRDRADRPGDDAAISWPPLPPPQPPPSSALKLDQNGSFRQKLTFDRGLIAPQSSLNHAVKRNSF